MCAAQTIPPTLCQVAEAPLEQPPRGRWRRSSVAPHASAAACVGTIAIVLDSAATLNLHELLSLPGYDPQFWLARTCRGASDSNVQQG